MIRRWDDTGSTSKIRFKETGNSKHFKDGMIEVPISVFPKMVVPSF